MKMGVTYSDHGDGAKLTKITYIVMHRIEYRIGYRSQKKLKKKRKKKKKKFTHAPPPHTDR